MRVIQRARMRAKAKWRRLMFTRDPFFAGVRLLAHFDTPFDGLPMDGKDGAIINDVLADLERDSKPPR